LRTPIQSKRPRMSPAIRRREEHLRSVPLMKENRISLSGRVSLYLMLGIFCLLALRNLAAGKVIQPKGLFIVAAGFVLFAISKFRIITRKKLINLGTKQMNESGANLYRVGYWLMGLGVLIIFLG